jgi:hypothetical protein
MNVEEVVVAAALETAAVLVPAPSLDPHREIVDLALVPALVPTVPLVTAQDLGPDPDLPLSRLMLPLKFFPKTVLSRVDFLIFSLFPQVWRLGDSSCVVDFT